MVEKSSEIVSLHQQVSSAIRAADISVDKRKFVPHITLGRYRHSKNTYVGTIPLNISLQSLVEEVVLYESVLTPSGAEYEPIYRFPLEEPYFDE